MSLSAHDTIAGMDATIPTPAELEAALCSRLGLSEEEKKDFLYPKYELSDPFLFSDMEKAVARLHRAVIDGEHVGIYGDYDCDGIPGAVVLVDLFKTLGIAERTHVYIPDRHDEGYGISTTGIDRLSAAGVTLIITVDVGITALAAIADANSRGIDVVVTDHHQPLSEYPAAHAILHPMHGTYPEKDLCGAGVAFTYVRAFLERHRGAFGIAHGWEKWLLDLVGFATLSDMVPLTGENRILASYGLTVLRKTRRIGLRTLLAVNNVALDRLTEQDLTFTVAPRLNAASRMDTAMIAFELLATDEISRAEAIVKKLEEINNERKLLVARIVKDAHGRLERRELSEIVVIGDLSWRPAVLGLVANKLQETYERSFFVWGEGGDGMIKGSCRMNSEHHAAYLFQKLPDGLLLSAGGHQAAGGFSIQKEKVHFLEEALNTCVHTATIASHEREETKEALPATLGIATVRHYDTIRRFAPFGVGNREPVFLFRQITVQSIKKFGKTKEHLECTVEDFTGEATAFIFFVSKEIEEKLTANQPVSFSATIEPGWRSGVRLRIKEVF